MQGNSGGLASHSKGQYELPINGIKLLLIIFLVFATSIEMVITWYSNNLHWFVKDTTSFYIGVVLITGRGSNRYTYSSLVRNNN